MPLKEYVSLPIEPLTRGEVDALLAQCSLRAPTGVRNRALIQTLHRCGLRCQEALDLLPRDIDLDAATMRVRHGKGDKARVVGLPADCAAGLALWLGVREATGGQPVFCKLDGGPIDPSYVRHLFKRLAVKAGVEKRVHPHGLRHTFAHELEREGQPLTVIRDALGHSSLSVTDRYLRPISGKAVTDAMRVR